jgi:hypothetical protein
VSPENRALDVERVQDQKRLFCCPTVKVGRHLAWHAGGAAITGAIWNYKADVATQFLNLAADGVHAIAPSSV